MLHTELTFTSDPVTNISVSIALTFITSSTRYGRVSEIPFTTPEMYHFQFTMPKGFDTVKTLRRDLAGL